MSDREQTDETAIEATQKVRIVNVSGRRLRLHYRDGTKEPQVFEADHAEARLENRVAEPGRLIYGLPLIHRITASGISPLPTVNDADRVVYIVSQEVGEWVRVNAIHSNATFIGPEYSQESPRFNWGESVAEFERFVVYKA